MFLEQCGAGLIRSDDMIDDRELLEVALEAAEKAYAPYSQFKVGAAVVGGDGLVYTGCNIENASYGATVCAERVAIFNAISSGNRKIVKLAVISPSSQTYTMPCGICRQVAMEFGGKKLPVLCGGQAGHFKQFTLEELLPEAFETF